MAHDFSPECDAALRLLARSRNVLISGPPGTGKSKLLAEIAAAFGKIGQQGDEGPVHDPGAAIPIPAGGEDEDEDESGYPAPDKPARKVFRTVFHQNSKYRDFVSGLTPSVNAEEGKASFRVVQGTLYRASEHARAAGGASLLIIDEINRGPAVQVFGGAIVAIEPDKRLASDGAARPETQFFELMAPDGEIVEYALPHDLYILAAMNQADASVEPLDVAFLRRWEPLRLEPDEAVLRSYYGLGENAAPLPAEPASTADAFEASARAWKAVNDQIGIGRGPEFQIGHGVLMSGPSPVAMSLDEAKAYLCVGWSKVKAHVDEVFFGDTRGASIALNALGGAASNPFALQEVQFGDELRHRLTGPANFTPEVIYRALRAFARE